MDCVVGTKEERKLFYDCGIITPEMRVYYTEGISFNQHNFEFRIEF